MCKASFCGRHRLAEGAFTPSLRFPSPSITPLAVLHLFSSGTDPFPSLFLQITPARTSRAASKRRSSLTRQSSKASRPCRNGSLRSERRLPLRTVSLFSSACSPRFPVVRPPSSSLAVPLSLVPPLVLPLPLVLQFSHLVLRLPPLLHLVASTTHFLASPISFLPHLPLSPHSLEYLCAPAVEFRNYVVFPHSSVFVAGRVGRKPLLRMPRE